ncbi:MAG: MBL fold metallo-hydrolase [Planctomycetes bacterium]|jgi:ribonuclease BN (tRNA processing enzyme)|nr:MBL fold metallo-hydrolase [Planctomycetota bacterium]
MMELTILGSGTGVPSPRRGSPGALVRASGGTILVDCGPGSLRVAAAAGVDPASIDGVLLTHFHPDHVLDLPALLFALRNPAFAGRGPLTVAGPEGTVKLIDHWFSAAYGAWLRPVGFDLTVLEFSPGEHVLAGVRATAFPVKHAPESLAYRVREADGEAVLAISGDTGLCAGIVEAGRDADLLLLECAFPDPAPWDGHLTPRTAAEVAALSAPRRLVLTHFYPEVEREPIEAVVAERYAGPVERAEDGATYRIR